MQKEYKIFTTLANVKKMNKSAIRAVHLSKCN